ncbi:MAG: metalloregulator ArsR/SmtB family transcription factor [Actinomycetota bacterium]
MNAKAEGVTEAQDDGLDRAFAALADPTRRAIVARLALGEASVTELAEPFQMSLPAVSKHLKVLERAGLITRSNQAQWRYCRLQPAPLQHLAQWLAGYQRLWDESYERLDEYLALLQRKREQEGDEQ